MNLLSISGKAPRFLIMRGGALGDFLLTLPVVHELRRWRPDAYIEWIGSARIAELALSGGLLDRVRSLDSAGYAAWFYPNHVWTSAERAWLEAFDCLICYLGEQADPLRLNLRCLNIKNILFGAHKVADGHAADHFLQPLVGVGVESGAIPARAQLSWPPERRAEGLHRLAAMGVRNGICLHPGSGSPRKNCAPEVFAALAGALRQAALGDPFFLIGEADAVPARALAHLAPSIPVISGLTLMEAAALLAACRGYVGNDSGMTHLAAALGIPVVALFCATDPAVWAPRGGNVTVLQAAQKPAPNAEREVGAILQALKNLPGLG